MSSSDAANPAVAVAPGGAVAVTWLHNPMADWRLEAVRQGGGVAGLETGAPQEVFNPIADVGLFGDALTRPSIAIDGQDRFTMAFWDNNGLCPNECAAGDVQVTTRDANGAWSVPEQKTSASNSLDAPPAADVAVDPDGNAFLVWSHALHTTSGPVTESSIFGRSRSGAAGSWSGEQTLSATAPGHGARDPQVAAGPQGRAVAVWNLGGRVEASDLRRVVRLHQDAVGGRCHRSAGRLGRHG